jgi:hypothetical protein
MTAAAETLLPLLKHRASTSWRLNEKNFSSLENVDKGTVTLASAWHQQGKDVSALV